MAHVTSDEVVRYLGDVDFPAGKEDLLRAADDAGAPPEVLKALRAIPPEQYANRAEVARSVPTDPAADLDPSAAQRAEQARERRHRGPHPLSEYERKVPKPPIEDELDRTHGRTD
ncbi:MAG TPA: DUF2795 domain-containing protein [Streptosporangiaceae bacterium]|jgi:hypothetical protein